MAQHAPFAYEDYEQIKYYMQYGKIQNILNLCRQHSHTLYAKTIQQKFFKIREQNGGGSYEISISLYNHEESEYKAVTEDGAAFIGQGIFVKYPRMGIIQYERVGKSSGKTYV